MLSIKEFVRELVKVLQERRNFDQENMIHAMFSNVIVNQNLIERINSESLKKAALEQGRTFNGTASRIVNVISAESFSRWLKEDVRINENTLKAFVNDLLVPNNLASENDKRDSRDIVANAFVEIIRFYAHTNRHNEPTTVVITYDKYIEIIANELKISHYEAVLTTLPDLDFSWKENSVDERVHFLHEKMGAINNANQNLLEVVIGDSDNTRVFLHKVEDSIYRINTYRSWIYVREIMKHLFKKHDVDQSERNIYDSIYRVLNTLSKNEILPDMTDFNNCFYTFPNEYDMILDNKSQVTDNLLALFFKTSSLVILYNLNQRIRKNFKLAEANDEIVPPKIQILQNIKKSAAELEIEDEIQLKLYGYYYLYKHHVENKSDKYISAIAEYFYQDFFALVNDKKLQDKYLFGVDKELTKILESLYKRFYYEEKFFLYRGYDVQEIDEPCGFMRWDLLDRKIARDFLDIVFPNHDESKFNSNAELVFNHITPLLTDEKFILRPANSDDIGKLILLNNPVPPFRRAMYIPSNENEITQAVNKHMVWLIEQNIDGNRALACAAIILKYNFDKSNASDYASFNSDSLNTNYAMEYFEKVKRPFAFVDFDSVITYSGRNIAGGETNDIRAFRNKSYRGYGFQRLMMVLCEELAEEIYKADYIVGTVSSLNKFSRRNFALQGYKPCRSVMYGLDEGMEESPFYVFINGRADIKPTQEQDGEWFNTISEEAYEYQDVLETLDIEEDDYWEDKKVPRMFMLLQLR